MSTYWRHDRAEHLFNDYGHIPPEALQVRLSTSAAWRASCMCTTGMNTCKWFILSQSCFVTTMATSFQKLFRSAGQLRAVCWHQGPKGGMEGGEGLLCMEENAAWLASDMSTNGTDTCILSYATVVLLGRCPHPSRSFSGQHVRCALSAGVRWGVGWGFRGCMFSGDLGLPAHRRVCCMACKQHVHKRHTHLQPVECCQGRLVSTMQAAFHFVMLLALQTSDGFA